MFDSLNKMLFKKSRAYKALFNKENVYAKEILKDLRKFCRADAPTFTPGDPHMTSLLEGRREVWNRIMKYIDISEEELKRIDKEMEEQEEQDPFKI